MKKVRTPAEQKALMERESAERMNKVAAALEEKNDLQDDGIKLLQYPLSRADGERESQISGVKVIHGRRSMFNKIKEK
ncbi:hypothetical protein ES702_06154 [subsurface metagenome]